MLPAVLTLVLLAKPTDPGIFLKAPADDQACAKEAFTSLAAEAQKKLRLVTSADGAALTVEVIECKPAPTKAEPADDDRKGALVVLGLTWARQRTTVYSDDQKTPAAGAKDAARQLTDWISAHDADLH